MTTPYRVTAQFWDHATLWSDNEHDAGHSTDGGRVFGITRTRYVECDHYRCKPVAVIDPEDAEQVERLVRLFTDAMPKIVVGLDPDDRDAIDRIYVNAGQAALREFADPKPRIEEPTGLGAVVRDVEGILWTRVEAGEAQTRNPWYPADAADFQPDEWHNLCAVEILAAGWSA